MPLHPVVLAATAAYNAASALGTALCAACDPTAFGTAADATVSTCAAATSDTTPVVATLSATSFTAATAKHSTFPSADDPDEHR
jgi:hypothetical protein